MNLQAELKETLSKVGIAKKSIDVFGSQIIITCWSEKAAKQWGILLNRFCSKVRGIAHGLDQTKESQGRKPEYVEVYRVGGTI